MPLISGVPKGDRIVITNEAQFSSTKAHLDCFEEAACNIKARSSERTKLEQLELDAVRSKADDLPLIR